MCEQVQEGFYSLQSWSRFRSWTCFGAAPDVHSWFQFCSRSWILVQVLFFSAQFPYNSILFYTVVTMRTTFTHPFQSNTAFGTSLILSGPSNLQILFLFHLMRIHSFIRSRDQLLLSLCGDSCGQSGSEEQNRRGWPWGPIKAPQFLMLKRSRVVLCPTLPLSFKARGPPGLFLFN